MFIYLKILWYGILIDSRDCLSKHIHLFLLSSVLFTLYYLCRHLASGEGIVSLGICVCLCVRPVALVSPVKIMRCIQCSLVILVVRLHLLNVQSTHTSYDVLLTVW